MKLRRRLLNRLARRLNRIARAMDGEDVVPPQPPKYGDLRLHIDPKAVEEFKNRLQCQQAAKERIRASRKEQQNEKKNSETKDTETAIHDKEKEEEESKEVKKEEEENPDTNAGEDMEEEEGTPEKQQEKEEEEDVDMQDVQGQDTAADDDSKEPTKEKDPKKESQEEDAELLLERDYDMIKEYKDGYEKAVVVGTGTTDETTKYTLLLDPHRQQEEDYVTIKYGAGIGAAHRSMSFREKEMDYKRWQHTLLAKIPEQPTLEELGFKHRVFFQEERTNRLEKQKGTDETPKKNNASKKQRTSKRTAKTQDSDDEDDNDDDDKEEEEQVEPMELDDDDEEQDKEEEEEDLEKDEDKENDEDEDEEEEEETEEDKEDDDDDEDFTDGEDGKKKNKDDDDDTENDKDEDEEENKDQDDESKSSFDLLHQKRKVISLSAVPSFYDQDMRRTRLIHADLMATSTQQHAREMIVEATNDYNTAFKRSNALYNQRVKVQTELNSRLYETRVTESKRKNDYMMQVAIARSRWKNQHDTLNAQKLLALMPCYSGRIAVGTTYTTAASTSANNPLRAQVAVTMANVVDSVVTMRETGWKTTPVSPFVPPPPPPTPPSLLPSSVDPVTGESLEKKRERIEASLRSELSTISSRLQASEEDRKRAWKKLQKTRAEVGANLHWTPGQRGGRMDPMRMQQQPVPALRASVLAVAPPPIPRASSVPAYIPPFGNHRTAAPPALAPSEYAAKYSAAKVKERISADGTVAPVSEPKRTKDGLFQRPAGRTRKGMEWDAVRGIWVPE